MDDSPRGKIITFYSYKGGTGRSMALANAACWLVRSTVGATPRILMMDWDLEAPGLHRYFESRSERPEDFERPGVIDYFVALRDKLNDQPNLYELLCSDQGPDVFLKKFPLHPYIIPNVVPNVDLIKAGKLDAAYAEIVSTFGWVDFHKNYGGTLEPFREMLASQYDYILVDSRTGFNDVSGVCTMLIPETLVVVFTPNRQSLSGVIDLATRATNYRRGSNDFRPLSVFPLPSRIENAEQELKRDWRRQYQQEFEGALKRIYQLEACDLTNYFDKVQLPQVPFYAYGEKIALLEDRSDALSLGGAYETFFQKLIGLNFAWDAPVKEAQVEVQPLLEPESVAADVYISYAHVDNLPFSDGTRGWVETFRETLSIRLQQLSGRAVNIVYDPKLQGNDFVHDTLQLTISKATVFIAILSPRYVMSEWCKRELQLATARGAGELLPIYKVVKTFVPIEQQPEELRRYLGYEFFEIEKESGRHREFRPHDQSASDSKYLAKIDDLAWDITQALEGNRGDGPAQEISRVAVYLAETTSDLVYERDRIKRELQQRGLQVFPDKALPFSALELTEAVLADLKRCALSVHLLGVRYGVVPEGEPERSIVRMQIDMASDRAANLEFKQLIWIPKESSPTEERQQEFVNGLLSGSTPAPHAEVLQTSLGDLKDHILASLQKTQSQTKTPEDRLVRIYLIVDQSDVDAVAPLHDYLFERGCEVTLPLAEGTEAEIFQDHKDNLMLSDAVVIYQGRASEGWLRMKLRELLKLPGYGRETPLRGKAIYVGPPASPTKERFKTLEAMVIKNFGEFDPMHLEAFIASIWEDKGRAL